MSEITEQDVQAAKNMSRRWAPRDGRFSTDDAFQEMMLSLLERDIPTDKRYARLNEMKEAARNKSIESSYLMRIPAGSWRYLGGAPKHAKHTGLTTDMAGDDGVPEGSLASHEEGYEEVDDRVALAQALATLPDKERVRLLKWANNPHSVTGTAFYAMRATVAKLRERHQREENAGIDREENR